MFFENARAYDEIGDLALFAHLPIHEIFDVGMIGVEHDHFRCAARRSAGLDRSRGAIENFEERHQAAGGAATRELLTGCAELREVGSAAAAALKNTCFAQHAVEDPAFVNEIVLNGQDKAVVDDDVASEERPALGLNVVDRHFTQRQYGFDAHQTFLPSFLPGTKERFQKTLVLNFVYEANLFGESLSGMMKADDDLSEWLTNVIIGAISADRVCDAEIV